MHRSQQAVETAEGGLAEQHLPHDAAGNAGNDPGNQRRRSEDGGADEPALFAPDHHQGDDQPEDLLANDAAADKNQGGHQDVRQCGGRKRLGDGRKGEVIVVAHEGRVGQ